MFHEANHYLTTLIDPKFVYPSWVNESMGEYYGSSTWDPKTKKMELGGIQEGRLAVVQEAILANEWQGLEALIRQPRFEAIHYAWGWTLVHWLLENKATQKKFKDFYLALGRDKSIKREPAPQDLMKQVPADEQIRVLLKYLGVKDLKELETGWYDYIKSLKPSSGRGYFEAGQQALQADQPIRAQRLLRQAIEKGFETPTVYATLARAQRRKAQAQDAIESMRKAISMDPTERPVLPRAVPRPPPGQQRRRRDPEDAVAGAGSRASDQRSERIRDPDRPRPGLHPAGPGAAAGEVIGTAARRGTVSSRAARADSL
jgi:tetratricopeptide (TPR) repeat protein